MVEVVRLAIPIPKGLSAKQVTGHFNPSPDGNCGYRAIAHAIFDDEASFGNVQHEMLLCMRKNERFYRQVFVALHPPLKFSLVHLKVSKASLATTLQQVSLIIGSNFPKWSN